MDVKRISGYNIPRASIWTLTRLAADQGLDDYLQKHYSARCSKETHIVIVPKVSEIHYKVWAFDDMDKYTEFCLRWL